MSDDTINLSPSLLRYMRALLRAGIAADQITHMAAVE